MSSVEAQPVERGGAAGICRIASVSFLNARPLVEGLDAATDVKVHFDVPSRLLHALEAGEVDVALCPVVDYHRATEPVTIVRGGGIACEGESLTVRLFSRCPVDQITTVHTDRDSHTSVVLLQVVLHHVYGISPRMEPLDAAALPGEGAMGGGSVEGEVESMLLIGDKVVTAAPDGQVYPHQLDLGEQWWELTGLPFVFATWMARPEAATAELARRLEGQRQANAGAIERIAREYGPRHGWPVELARQYLSRTIRYQLREREMEAIRRFSAFAADLGLIEQARPLRAAP